MAIVLVLLIGLLVFVQTSKPEELNWFPSYSAKAKIPLGSYIFYDQLQKKTDAQRVQNVTTPPFEFLIDSVGDGTYFFLNNDVSFDPSETKKILKWVGRGNTLFVAATYQSKKLLDTLNLELATFYEQNSFTRKPLLNLSNPGLKRERPYLMDKDLGSSYFKSLDTANTTVLGVYDRMRDQDSTAIIEPKVNFVKVPFENGFVYLHLFPQAFSNFFMLEDDNSDYTAGVLAYLPKEKTLFLDHYYKTGKTYNTSPLFLIFSNKYLKWAYYLLLIIAVLWVYFEGKRKQRSIPVIRPRPNQTLDFTRTIANMYLENKDHKEIAQHQINHFLEYVRSAYTVSTGQLNENFINTVAAKSGSEQTEVKQLVNTIITIRQQPAVSEQQLIELNTRIENFKAKN
ncbi:DUF4350 domain-containing protein [Flavimarina sp. Hel_I_48]|uniref:DUF4350 domain-containing protein n=1 Tax=Flavimarina sp. Hel_I_48 TaxID=1392488 RepID=UPI001F13B21A|nr:DUF4350 domain-containing protein [Flavimarina sp. Hel_I_48]